MAAAASAPLLIYQTPFLSAAHQNNLSNCSSVPKFSVKGNSRTRSHGDFIPSYLSAKPVRLGSLEALTPLRAVQVGGVEPDLEEERESHYITCGEGEDFPFGIADGAHTWHEGDDGDVKEEFLKVFTESGGPTGFQGVISWLFLPGLFTGMALNIQGEYLYIYTALFIFAFIGIEMAKPVKPFHFEPEIYNMEEKARDKFIEDYNSMDIWDFNEKYKDII